MEENKLNELNEQLAKVLDLQQKLSLEIMSLKNRLDAEQRKTISAPFKEVVQEEISSVLTDKEEKASFQTINKGKEAAFSKEHPKATTVKSKASGNLEAFVAGDLFSKIGIGILILGASIGIKYAYDHFLISNWAKIIFAYLGSMAVGMVGLYLKKKYHQLSAVIVGGSLSLLFLTTYFAADYYQLISFPVAFIMMLVWMALTIFVAFHYDIEYIALIGLVGSYATPVLLNQNNGKLGLFFSFLSLLNVGILFISYRKNWKSLYYVAFLATSLIFFAILSESTARNALPLGIWLLFAVIYYFTFAGISWSFIQQNKEIRRWDELAILLTSNMFSIGISYNLLNHFLAESADYYVAGICTGVAALNAMLVIASFRQSAHLSTISLLLGITFISLTSGLVFALNLNALIIALALEILLVCRVAKHFNLKSFSVFAVFGSIVLIVMTLLYLFFGDSLLYGINEDRKIRYVEVAIVGLLFFLNHLSFRVKEGETLSKEFTLLKVQSLVSSYIIIYCCVLKGMFEFRFTENGNAIVGIIVVWTNLFSYLIYRFIHPKFKITELENFFVFTFHVLLFFNLILFSLHNSDIVYRGSGYDTSYTNYLFWRILMYISFALIVAEIFKGYKKKNSFGMPKFMMTIFMVILFWITSLDIYKFQDFLGLERFNRFGISIYMMIYSVAVVYLGFRNELVYFRKLGLIFMLLTLCKLFLIDLILLGTGGKAIVLIVFGIIMLLTSYLYNRYKEILIGSEEIRGEHK